MQQSGSMIISFLRKKICSTANRANVKFFNGSKKMLNEKLHLLVVMARVI